MSAVVMKHTPNGGVEINPTSARQTTLEGKPG
jgi:hypothetical protein